jgi:CheY-like chemotaxis protein
MKHVLIVDDALEFGRLLQTALAVLGHGMAVAVVPSAEEALLEAGRYPVDLLVSDYRLPGMTGFELARKIRTQQPKIKVIVVTGMTDARLGQQALDAGADLFFRKPLEIPQFLDAVTRLLQIETPRTHLTTQASLSVRPGTPARLEDVLVGLRSHLGAQASLALNARGQVVVRSGDVPAVLERPEWRELAVGALASAGILSRRIHPAGGTSLQLLRCGEFDLALMPYGENLLVLILRTGPSALRLAISVEELLQLSYESASPGPLEVQSQLAAAEMVPTQPVPVVVAPSQPVATPLQESDLAEFVAALQKPVTAANLDADAFWEDTARSTSSANRPGAISFEEATRMGLTSQEE